MNRPPAPRVAQRNAGLLQRMQERKAEPPSWGNRRIWADLPFIARRAVNKKRMLRLPREHPLLVICHQRLHAKWTPTRSTPKPTRPHEWWGIDMTKILVQGMGWVSRVGVLDWESQGACGRLGGDAVHGAGWALGRGYGGESPVPAWRPWSKPGAAE